VVLFYFLRTGSDLGLSHAIAGAEFMRLVTLLVGASKAIPDGEILTIVKVEFGMVHSVMAGAVHYPKVANEINLVMDGDSPHIDSDEKDNK